VSFFFPGKYDKIISALKRFGLSISEGGNHSCTKCIENGKKTTIPRHNNVKSEVVNNICKFLLEKEFKKEEILKSMK